MRAGPIVIFHVTEQQVTEVALAEYNNVVKAFPPDRTDQPFSISILPRGARRRRSIANAHRSKPSDEDLTIGPVPVTNEIAGSLFPAAGFRDLICDPFCERATGTRIRPVRNDLDADDQRAKAGDPQPARLGDLRAAGSRRHPRVRRAQLDAGPGRPARPRARFRGSRTESARRRP